MRTIAAIGWKCRLDEAPPGPFVTLSRPDLLCFKAEHRQEDGKVIAYNSAGEFFPSGDDCMVQPVRMADDAEPDSPVERVVQVNDYEECINRLAWAIDRLGWAIEKTADTIKISWRFGVVVLGLVVLGGIILV